MLSRRVMLWIVGLFLVATGVLHVANLGLASLVSPRAVVFAVVGVFGMPLLVGIPTLFVYRFGVPFFGEVVAGWTAFGVVMVAGTLVATTIAFDMMYANSYTIALATRDGAHRLEYSCREFRSQLETSDDLRAIRDSRAAVLRQLGPNDRGWRLRLTTQPLTIDNRRGWDTTIRVPDDWPAIERALVEWHCAQRR